MSSLATIIGYVATKLNGLGLHAARGTLANFDEEGISSLNNAYVFRQADARLLQATSSTTHYNPFRCVVRIARQQKASSNTGLTNLEDFTDLLALAESVESALTTKPTDGKDYSIRCDGWRQVESDHSDWMLLDFDATIEAERQR